MESLKRHSALPALLLAVCVIVLLSWRLAAAKDDGTLELVDIEGDRAALNGATISGSLADGFHRTAFAVTDGKVYADTEVRDIPAMPDEELPFHPGARRMIDGIYYEARPDFDWMAYEIRYEDRRDMSRYVSGSAIVRTGLNYRPEREGQYSYTNDLNYGIAKIGDTVYFTVTTTKDYSGRNGLYAIDAFSGRGNPADRDGSVRELAAIDLERNRDLTEAALGLEVLGLEAAGDRLALLLVDEGRLSVRAYDPDGMLLGELTLDDVAVTTGPSGDRQGELHYESYEAYPDHDLRTLNVSLRRSPGAADTVGVTILSFDLSDGVRLIGKVAENYERERVERDLYGVTSISRRNGKLYVVKTLQETAEESGIIFAGIKPRHLMIDVYDDRERVYRGELKSDANDDLIRVVNWDSRGFGYDASEYRHFTGITIR